MERAGKLVIVGIVTLTLLVLSSTENLTDVSFNQTSASSPKCPLGFSLFLTNSSLIFCYRYKPPEVFADYDKDCVGNLYTLEFAEDIFCQNGNENKEVWTDFKRIYKGGPLVKWSPSDGMGLLLNDDYRDEAEARLHQDETREYMCSAFNTSSMTVRPTSCFEKYSRLCVVRSYEPLAEYEGCPTSFLRMYSPLAACVAPAAASHQRLRVTWEQAQLKCSMRENSALLHSAFIYANHPDLQPSGGQRALPSKYMPIGREIALNESGVYVESFKKLNKYDDPMQDMELKLASINESITTLDVRNWEITRVDKKGVTFHYVLCEQLLEIPRLGMAVNYDESSGVLSLTVNSSSVSDEGIWCFTDAKTIYPERVTVLRSESDRFIIEPKGDGYYWCVNVDTMNFLPEESNAALYIEDKLSIADVFAIKIYWEAGYSYSTLNRVIEHIWGSLDEIFFLISSQQNKLDGDFGDLKNKTQKETDTEYGVSHEKRAQDSSSRTPMKYLRPKRTNPDGHTLLLHLQLDPKFSALLPSSYAEFRVIYMRPVYFCQRNRTLPSLEMNKTENCHIYTCEGSFIEGLRFLNDTVPDCQKYSSNQQDISNEMILAEDISADETHYVRRSLIRPYWSEQSSSSSEETTPIHRPGPSLPTLPTDVTEISSDQSTPLTHSPLSTVPDDDTTTVSTTPTAEVSVNTPTPDEQIEEVITGISQQLDEEQINMTNIQAAASQVSALFELDPDVYIPPDVLVVLDRLGNKVVLGAEGQAVVAERNFVIAAADTGLGAGAGIGDNRSLAGIRVTDSEEFTNDSIHFIWTDYGSSDTVWQSEEMMVILPYSVRNIGRISFVVFRSDRAFGESTAERVNSRIVSINVNDTPIKEGEFVEIHLRPIDANPPQNETKTCVYWNFTMDDPSTADWSPKGCWLRPTDDSTSLDVCVCDHLTHFAEIITRRTANSSNLSAADKAALSIISTIGCSFSLVGLTIIALTAAIFRSWRREFTNKVWLNLSASITLLITTFLIISLVDFESGENTTLCVATGIILHYSILSSFCWMFVAAVLSYQRLVIVFSRGESHQLLKACVFSWGFPCIIIGALLVVDPHNYEHKIKYNETVYMYSFCYPTDLGFWLTVFLPVLTAVVANTLLFCVIVFSVFGGSRVVQQSGSSEAVRCITVSFLLIFLFGITWIFGLFAEVKFAAYIFSMTATFQGFVLFVFFVAGNKKTRDLWLSCLKLKKKKKMQVTSSTHSTYKEAGACGSAKIPTRPFRTFPDGVNTKPRSLTGKDNGRFF